MTYRYVHSSIRTHLAGFAHVDVQIRAVCPLPAATCRCRRCDVSTWLRASHCALRACRRGWVRLPSTFSTAPRRDRSCTASGCVGSGVEEWRACVLGQAAGQGAAAPPPPLRGAARAPSLPPNPPLCSSQLLPARLPAAIHVPAAAGDGRQLPAAPGSGGGGGRHRAAGAAGGQLRWAWWAGWGRAGVAASRGAQRCCCCCSAVARLPLPHRHPCLPSPWLPHPPQAARSAPTPCATASCCARAARRSCCRKTPTCLPTPSPRA